MNTLTNNSIKNLALAAAALVAAAVFATPVCALAATISGTLYQADGATPIASKTINASLAGGAVGTQTATTDGSGNFTITFQTTPAAGNGVVVYVDADATTRAALVTKAGGTGNITGASLYKDSVIVKQESGATSTTNADFGTGSAFDTDIQYTLTSGALATATSTRLYVWGGTTFNPGATATSTGDFTIASGATFVAPAIFAVNGSFSNSGTFTAGSGTATLGSPFMQYLNGSDITGTTGSGSGVVTNMSSVFVSGNYAYVAAAANAAACSNTPGSAVGCELRIYDISTPSVPVYVRGIDVTGTVGSGTGNAGMLAVFVSGNYLYTLAGGSISACSNTAGSAIGCEIQIYDVSNPLSPSYVAGIDVTGTTGSGTGNPSFSSLFVSGNFLYVTKGTDSTTCSSLAGSAIGCELQVYNVTTPTAPTYAAGVDASGTTGSGIGALSLNGVFVANNTAYVASASNTTACSNSAGFAVGCELKIFDVTTPSAPVYKSGVDASGTVGSGTGSVNFNKIYVSGGYAYVPSGSNATACSNAVGSAVGCELKIFNVSSSTVPLYVAGVDASGTTNSGTAGLIENIIFVSGNYAYVGTAGSATTCGSAAGSAFGCEIQVYDISNPVMPTYVAGMDSSGLGGSGAAATAFSSLYVSGNYVYGSSFADGTTCGSAAGSGVGCEFKVMQNGLQSQSTMSGTLDGSSAFNNLAFVGAAYQLNSRVSTTNFSDTGGYLKVPVEVNVDRDYYANGTTDFTGGTLRMSGAAATRTAPVPVALAGADASGFVGSGIDGVQFNNAFVSGSYAYVASSQSGTACSNTAGSAIGCELKIFNISNPQAPIYVAGVDSTGSSGSGTGSGINFVNVYVSGNYAYVITSGSATACSNTAGSAIGCEIQIYDISNPAAPTYVKGIDVTGTVGSGTGNNSLLSVFVSSNTLYVAGLGNTTACSNTAGSAIGCELKIFDVTTPTAPTYLAGIDSFTTIGSGTGNLSFTDVYVSGTNAYVTSNASSTACSSSAGAGGGCELKVFNVSTPSAPTYSAGVDQTGTTGSGVGGTISFNKVFVSGTTAYVITSGSTATCASTAGLALGCELEAYNVSTPSAPAYVGGADTTGTTNSGLGNSVFSSIYVSSNYAYVASAANATACGNVAGFALGCELKIFDITTPAAPAYVSGSDSTGATGLAGSGNGIGAIAANGVFVSGDYAYVAKSADATDCGTFANKTGCELTVFGLRPNAVISADGGQGLSLNNVYIDSTGTTTLLATSTLSGSLQNASYLLAQSTGPLTIGGSLTNSGTLLLPASLAVGGNYANTGTAAVATTTAITFNGASSQSLSGTMIGLNAFGSTTFSGAGTKSFAANASTSNLSIQNGATVAAPPMLTVNGFYQNNATFSAQGGTVYFSQLFNGRLQSGIDASGTVGSGGGNASLNDIFVSGKYAYVATAGNVTTCSNTPGSAIGCELQIYDISNPLAPVYVAGIDASGTTASTTSSTFNSVYVSGNYAYVAKAGDAGTCSNTAGFAVGCELQIYNVTTPTAPTYVAGIDTTAAIGSGIGSVPFTKVFVSGNYAYVTSQGNATACSSAAASGLGCEFKIFNISTPSAPTYVAGVDSSGTTGSGTGSVTILNSVFVSGNYAYITSLGSATACSNTAGSAIGCEVQIYNVTTPSAPAYAAGIDATGAIGSGTFSQTLNGLYVSGNYLYVTSNGTATACSSAAASAAGCELQIYNIATPSAPVYVAGIDTTGTTGSGTGSGAFSSVYVYGNYAYAVSAASATACSSFAGSAIGCEIKVFNVTNPAAPAYAAGVDTTGTVGSGIGSQALNNVFVSGNYVYVTSTGNATTCNNTAGSAIGCDLKIFMHGVPISGTLTGSSALYGASILGDYNFSPTSASTTNLTIGSAGLLTAPMQLSISGNYANAGAFVATSSTVLLDGATDQSLSGNLSGDNGFYNLRLSNTGGTVSFVATTTATSTFTILPGGSARFAANATSTFVNIDWQGSALGPAFVRSTVDGTKWGLAVPGTRSVSRLYVRDSNACSGYANIDGGSTSFSEGNNTCWTLSRTIVFGGTGGGGGAIGGNAPAGQGIVSGGGGGGSAESIGTDPAFFAPSANGTATGWASGWTTAGNAYTQDTAYATGASRVASDFYNFGFNIPSGDVVTGIAIKIIGSGTTAAGTIAAELSWNGGTATTTAGITTSSLTTGDTLYTLGDGSTLWGRSWAPAEFGDANFRVRLAAVPSSNTLRIDAIQVRVYHQASGGGGGGSSEI